MLFSTKKTLTSENENFDDDEQDLDEDNYDDSESFQTAKPNEDIISASVAAASSASSKGGNSGATRYDPVSSTLKLKQITKTISPKWPNRVFAVELIRRIIQMCASSSLNSDFTTFSLSNDATESSLDSSNGKNLKQLAHFDLQLAKKLKQKQQAVNMRQKNEPEENYLILFLQDLMRIACIATSGCCDTLKLAGLDLLNDLILYFARVEEPNPEFKGHLILEQYQAQVSAALRPQFSIETSAHVTAKACQVCSMWISSGVARDLNDLRRVHQLLVSSLQKLSNPKSGNSNSSSSNGETGPALLNMSASNENLIYSELSLTVEKLAVLRAWAEVYIVAQKNTIEKNATAKSGKRHESNSESLLSLVQPELAILSYHWSVALKDHAYLSLPNGKIL